MKAIFGLVGENNNIFSETKTQNKKICHFVRLILLDSVAEGGDAASQI